jgi:hypothetical protein
MTAGYTASPRVRTTHKIIRAAASRRQYHIEREGRVGYIGSTVALVWHGFQGTAAEIYFSSEVSNVKDLRLKSAHRPLSSSIDVDGSFETATS